MKVLWLTPELPSPTGPGGAMRQWQLLRHLVARDHQAVVVAPVHETEGEGSDALRAAGVDLRGYERPPSRVREAAGLLARRPSLVVAALREPLLAWQADVFWSALGPLAARATAETDFDVVCVTHDWAADWIHRVDAGGALKVLGLENLTWEYYASRARSSTGPRRIVHRAEAWRWRRHALPRLADYDLLVTVSEPEAAALAALTATPVVPVPGGVDASAIDPPRAPADPDEPAVMFTGNMRWPPNAEGLRWLLGEVWPRVLREVPRARLFAIGADPPRDAVASAGERVQLPGRVPDLAPWFADASVVVVPILSGAGIRLKVIDALASRRPIVSTRMGADGVAVEDGRHVLLADDADAFAAAVVRLLRDPGLRARMGDAARELAEERYDWPAVAARFEGALREHDALRPPAPAPAPASADRQRLRRLLRVPAAPAPATAPAGDPEVLVVDLVLGRLAGGHNEDYLSAVLQALGDRAPVVWAPDRDGWGRPAGWGRRAHDIALTWLAMHPAGGRRRIVVTQNPSLWELLTLRAVTLLSRRRRAVAVFVLRRSGAAGSTAIERLSAMSEHAVRSLIGSRRLWPASDSRILLDELDRDTGVEGTLLSIPLRRSGAGAGAREGAPVASLVGAFRREKGAERYEAVVDAALAHPSGVEVDVQLGDGAAADGSDVLAARLRETWSGEPRVRVHGSFLPAAEYDAIIARSDVVVLPYLHEVYGTGTSGVLHEALAAGAVVLTTPIAWAVSEYGEHPRVRFLRAVDPASIATALDDALELAMHVRGAPVEAASEDVFGDRWREAVDAAERWIDVR